MTETPGAASPEHAVAVAWLGGIVLSGVGSGLALVALTLPWVVAEAGSGIRNQEVPLSALGELGLVFASLLVVMAVVAAILFSASRRPTATVRLVATMLGPTLPIAAILLGALTPKPRLVEALGMTSVAPSLTLSAKPAQGLIVFALGTALLGFGPMLAAWAPGPSVQVQRNRMVKPSRRRAATAMTAALVLAAVPVVLSLSLPWFETETSGDASHPLAEHWSLVYRIVLVAVLALMAGAALTAGGLRWGFRTAALYLCYGVWGVVLICVLLFWDPLGLAARTGVEVGAVRVGNGYLAAVIAVPLLLAALWAVPAPATSEAEWAAAS